MIVVSNTTTCVHLAAMGRLELFRLFGKVLIPDEVFVEIASGTSICGAGACAALASEIQRCPIANTLAVSLLRSYLGAGEAACIVLAQEVNADLVFLDDPRARLQAQAQGLKVGSTIGLLIAADLLQVGKFSFPQALDELLATGFLLHPAEQHRVLATWEHLRDTAPNALHRAARNGDTERVERLLAQGVDINGENRDRQTALHVAVRERQDDIVWLLLEKGANANSSDPSGRTPLDDADYDTANSLITAMLTPVVANFCATPQAAPFLVPEKPLPLSEIISSSFDLENHAGLSRSRLLYIEWPECPPYDTAPTTYYVLGLESGYCLYIESEDSDSLLLAALREQDETSTLFSTPCNNWKEFFRLLLLSNGRAFNTRVFYGLPSNMESDMLSRDEFEEIFYEVVEKHQDLWQKIEEHYGLGDDEEAEDEDEPQWKRKTVLRYLDRVFYK